MRIRSLVFAPNQLRRWLLVLLLGLLALASYWVLEITRNAGDSGDTVRTRPDYFVENFNFVKIPPPGKTKFRIVGTKLVHYPHDDRADITLPVVTSLDVTQPSMTAHAKRGTVKNSADYANSEVHLYDNVVLDRAKTKKTEHLELNTDYLLAYPDKNTMETDFPVEIITGDKVTTGVGLKANNATQQIEILKNVTSVIPPRK
jgi:lipopolysaccharide export system protein LptC